MAFKWVTDWYVAFWVAVWFVAWFVAFDCGYYNCSEWRVRAYERSSPVKVCCLMGKGHTSYKVPHIGWNFLIVFSILKLYSSRLYIISFPIFLLYLCTVIGYIDSCPDAAFTTAHVITTTARLLE